MAIGIKLRVHAGEHDRDFAPVTVDVPGLAAGGAYRLRDATGRVIPCQGENIPGETRLTWLVRGMKAGETRDLTLESTPEPADPVVRVEDDRAAGRVEITIAGKPFTYYHYGPQWVRPFLHPLIGPGNARVTRNWPVDESVAGEDRDHPHHKSVWVAHGACGSVDNWSEEPGHGYQIHRRFLNRLSGPVFGRLTARNDWTDSRQRKQFEEVRDLRFYALPRGERLFDLALTFRMTEKEVTFRDTKEGGLVSVRVASSMEVRRGGTITNAYGGIHEGETWGRPAPWCDYSGVADGQAVGIAVLDHPDNPRYPTPWHVRDYGLMTANCFALKHYRPDRKERGDMTFRKGSVTTWRYRIYVHRGNVVRGKVGARFLDLVAPPRVTLG